MKKTHYRRWDEKEIWKIPREKNTTDRSDRTERIDKTDRKYRKDRTEMTDRTDRADRTDTTGRTDRQNIIDINLTCQDLCRAAFAAWLDNHAEQRERISLANIASVLPPLFPSVGFSAPACSYPPRVRLCRLRRLFG